MQSARACLAGTILTAALVSACHTAPTPLPTVGVAYPPWARGFIQVAESSLQEQWGDTAHVPGFLVDSDPAPERVERTVEWTQSLLRQPGVSIIVGPSTSNAALAVAPMINAAAIPEIIPNATSRRLDQAGPWVFRLVENDSIEGAFLVRQILARPHLRRALILYTNDEYGQGLRTGIHDELFRAGLAPTAELPVGKESDFELLFRNEFTQRRPDVVICAVRNPEIARAAAALLRLGSRIPVFVGDGAFGPQALHHELGPLPFEIYGVAFWLRNDADSAGRAYIEEFQRIRHVLPRGEDALIHDALTLAATASRESGGDPHRMRLWLLSLGVTRPPFAGVAGPVDFRPDHHRPYRLGRYVADSAVDAEIR
ncbi:MAG: amino acid ABC transporter substrate-binding protein [Gemmatimonadetes bacterium]|nr:amino acid ABC transporter substrate-binding protein [Gemmatimonadota bacterium]